jgi:hypothetical protein
MHMTIATPTLNAVIQLTEDEYFPAQEGHRTFQVQKITFSDTGAKWGKRLIFEGPHIRKDGTHGQPIKKRHFTENEALRSVPSAVFNLLEEQFLVYDKAQDRIREALEA